MMFTSVSFAEWTEVGETTVGDTFYVDFDRIRNNDGFVYYWSLANYLEPLEFGTFSVQEYNKADCKLFRTQRLTLVRYKLQNGEGKSETDTTVSDWNYPLPNTIWELVLNLVCK